MRILIVDTYYPRFLQQSLLAPEFGESRSYVDFRNKLLALNFGTADYYSRHLVELGHTAEEIIFNCEPVQALWAAENGLGRLQSSLNLKKRLVNFAPRLGRFFPSREYLTEICVRQIEAFRPDVLYTQDLNVFSPEVIARLKRSKAVRLVAGQIASPLPDDRVVAAYDVIFSSFPHYVERLRKRGIGSEYFRLGFEPTVLDHFAGQPRDQACTFIGGFSAAHRDRINFLSDLAESVEELSFYGYGVDSLDPASAIVRKHHGEVWGLEMYRALLRSGITLNIHIGVAENYANNMRLYEATGCGAMLLTDAKDNLHEIFEPGKEVETYSSLEEAREKIRYYLQHPDQAAAIAAAGQRRTMKDHTYAVRMKQLAPMLEDHLARVP